MLGADADYARLVRMVVGTDLTHTNPAYPPAAGLVPYLMAAALTPLAMVAGGRAAAWRFVPGWVIGLPFLTGALDLAVRLAVP